jgi:hypothetical protein
MSDAPTDFSSPEIQLFFSASWRSNFGARRAPLPVSRVPEISLENRSSQIEAPRLTAIIMNAMVCEERLRRPESPNQAGGSFWLKKGKILDRKWG